MKIYLINQAKRFPLHLQDLKNESVKKYEKEKLLEKAITVEIDIKEELSNINARFFWEYKIFPDTIMCAYTEWVFCQRVMQVGDTIVQQVNIPPSKVFSIKIILESE
jgi:hypothetical protein